MMDFNTRINKINQVLKDYFDNNPHEQEIPAKNLMPQFISAEIFTKDHKKGLPIRKVLRTLDENNGLNLIPFAYPERKKVHTKWYFIRSNADIPNLESKKTSRVKTRNQESGRKDRDEHYVIDLCDEVLNLTASRQHTFDFLLGDLHKDGVTITKLPVDAFYEALNLVVEFMERQHTEEVAHFDKPDVMTVSGVSRGEQRKIYDQRRKELIPKHNIDLVIISYSDFDYNSQKKIIRNKTSDLETVREILSNYIVRYQ